MYESGTRRFMARDSGVVGTAGVTLRARGDASIVGAGAAAAVVARGLMRGRASPTATGFAIGGGGAGAAAAATTVGGGGAIAETGAGGAAVGDAAAACGGEPPPS